MTDIGANGQAVVLLTIAGRVHEVDAEIAPIVKALNDGGCPTVASCSGHGVRPGNIALADGRELIVAANYGEGRIVDKAFSSIETPVVTDIDKLAREIAEDVIRDEAENPGLVAIVRLAVSKGAKKGLEAGEQRGMKLQRERDEVIDPNVLDFLMGIAPLEGCYFGEKNPTRKGAFWWRTVLRERSNMLKQEAIRSAL